MELEIKSFKVGNRVGGKVIGVEKDVIYLDIGGSCDAKIDKQHYSYDQVADFQGVVNLGDEIETMITYVGDEQILLSRLPFEKDVKFAAMREKMEQKELLQLSFEHFNRGGLEHKEIFTYFMPASQIGVKGAQPKDYVNQPFEVIITDMDEKRKQIIVSARKVAESMHEEKKQLAWTTINVAQQIQVEITKVLEAGVEVRYEDIIRGFIPRKELSHLRFDSVLSLHQVGEVVTCEVIEKREDGQFTASLKKMLPTPWEAFAQQYKESDVVEGKIKKIIDIGAFVEIIPGVEGLLHKNEVSYDEFSNFRDLISEGEMIKIKIINIDHEHHKLSLSIKKIEKDPWDDLWEQYHEHDIIEVEIQRIERQHMWVSVIQYVNAIMYRKDALLKDNQELSDAYKEKDTIRVKIIELNPRRRRFVVSLAAIVRDEERQQLEDYRKKVEQEVDQTTSTLKDKFSAILK